MMSSSKPINDHLTPRTEQQQATDEPIKTFLDAQLAYAKSKHSKQAEQKKTAYKKAWYVKRGGRK